MFQEAGVEPGEVVEAGGHPQAALAVYNGEVDFATTYFSAPLTDPAWKTGDDPEPYDYTAVKLNDEGKAYAGDVRVLDARVAVMETAPDIFDEVRIMMLTDPIPNDTMSFSAEFPQDLRARLHGRHGRIHRIRSLSGIHLLGPVLQLDRLGADPRLSL